MQEPVNDWDDIPNPADAPQHHLASSTYTTGEGESEEAHQGEDDDPKTHKGDPARSELGDQDGGA